MALSSKFIRIFALILLFTGLEVNANSLEVSISSGFTTGNDATSDEPETETFIDGDEAFSVTIGLFDEYVGENSRIYELLVSTSELTFRPEGESSFSVDSVHIQLGGRYQWEHIDRVKPFLSGGLGASFYDSDTANEVFFTLGLGAGFNFYLTEQIGIRAEVRGIFNAVDSRGAFFCGNRGCEFALASELWVITQGTLGVHLRF